MRQPA